MRFAVFLLALIGLAGCDGFGDREGAVSVAAATNIKPALDVIERQFEANTGIAMRVSYGSTGKLTAQILNGAPFDVFLAADQARPAELVAADRVSADAVRPYAIGSLVFWMPGHDGGGSLGTALAATLGDGSVRHIALANPELAPYGRAAIETLETLDLAGVLEDRFVYGENIGQAFSLVATGNAQAGFIAASQATGQATSQAGSPGERLEGGLWAVPEGLHSPIVQDAVLLSVEPDGPAAQFMDWLSSDQARAVFTEHGYGVP